jgi:hypothetical protein
LCLHCNLFRESDILDDYDTMFDYFKFGMEPLHMLAIRQTIVYGNYIYAPIMDPTIDFEYARLMSISDLSESICVSDFRFS